MPVIVASLALSHINMNSKSNHSWMGKQVGWANMRAKATAFHHTPTGVDIFIQRHACYVAKVTS